MIKKIVLSVCVILPLFFNLACQNRLIDQGKQYTKTFISPFNYDILPPVIPVNATEYKKQIAYIKAVSSSLYNQNKNVYHAIDNWLLCLETGANKTLTGYQLAGTDYRGNNHLTGYYTPVVKARREPDALFRYPLYQMPDDRTRLPRRSEIYAGALDGQALEIAYTSSLIDNFLMQVQGSGYVDFEDASPLQYFAFSGKNNYGYQSIGRLLAAQGKIAKNNISIQVIKQWATHNDEKTVYELLKQNESFVFFSPKQSADIIGAAGIPLVANTAVAADGSVLPMGAVLLVEVPLLNKNGKFVGQREWRLMVVLDRGSAIHGHHLDIYQGIGQHAGEIAGYYNHYGRVWWIASS